MLSQRAPVLTYHSVDDSGSAISVSPELFRRQMEHLCANGWRTVRVDELLAGREAGGWPERRFALTFDDGFENFAEHALPVLRACQFSATVFIVSGWAGRTNSWPSQEAWVPRFPLLDWDGVRDLADAGVEIGAHSLSHCHLADLSRAEAEREVLGCQHEIELHIGRPVRFFAYPYGEHSAMLRGLVAVHFGAGFGTRLGFATPRSSPADIERLDTYYLRDPRFLSAMTTGWLRAYLQLRNRMRALRAMKGKVKQWPE